MQRTALLSTFCMLVALLASACMTTPTNGQKIATKATKLTVGGFVLSSSPVEVFAYNNSTKVWDRFTTITPSTQPYTDSDGFTWYEWVREMALPQGSAYWGYNGKGEPTIKVRAGGSRTSNSGALFTFDSTSSQCVVDTFLETGSGFSTISQCSSSQSPVAQVNVPCGGSTQVCCKDRKCSAGFACNSSNVCRAPTTGGTGGTGGGTGGTGGTGGSTSDPCAGAGGSCMVHPTECASSSFQSVGTLQCKSNKLVCVAKQGTDYCSICGGECGGCYGNSCGASALCAPGLACVYDYPTDRMMCKTACSVSNGYCWSQNEVGSCSAGPGTGG